MTAKPSTSPEPELVDLALLAVLIGGGALPSTSSLAKLVKRPLDHAVKQGLVRLTSESQTVRDSAGKAKRQTVKHYLLEDAGRDRVRALPDPDVRAVGAAMALRNLQASLGAAVDRLRDDVVKQIDEVATTVATQLSGWDLGGEEPIPTGTLRDRLAASYRALCRRVDYEDGLVDIPRLYRHVRQEVPGLSVDAVREELQRLWQAEDLDLRVLNEVDLVPADERAFGIPYSNALYFYVDWNKERS